MSAESRVLRNFKGLESIETLSESFVLSVDQGYGQVVELEKDSTQFVSPSDLRELGLRLNGDFDLTSLLTAIGEIGIAATDVDLLVTAENNFLKDRTIIYRKPSLEVEPIIHLLERCQEREMTLLDKRHGFKISVYFTLNKKLPVVAFRPRRLGTILASASFTVRVNRLGNGLIPKPLTEEVLKRADLPKGSILWVEQSNLFFDSTSLDDAVSIYIDEEIHSDLGRLRTKESRVIQTEFALMSLAQIVLLVGVELSNREVTAEDCETIFGEFLFTQVKKVLKDKAGDVRQVLDQIKANPSRVAALITAQMDFKRKLRALLIEEDGTK